MDARSKDTKQHASPTVKGGRAPSKERRLDDLPEGPLEPIANRETVGILIEFEIETAIIHSLLFDNCVTS